MVGWLDGYIVGWLEGLYCGFKLTMFGSATCYAFEKYWQELYRIRNKIAHNRGLTKSEHDRLVKTVDELEYHFQHAMARLNKQPLRSMIDGQLLGYVLREEDIPIKDRQEAYRFMDELREKMKLDRGDGKS